MKQSNKEAEVVRLRKENEILNTRLLKLEEQIRRKDEASAYEQQTTAVEEMS